MQTQTVKKMKTRFIFLLLLFILMSKAQITPAYVTTLTTDSNIWINSSCLDTKTKIMYLCYAESGFIKKLDLATNIQTMAVSGLSYPICSAVIGNRLYFLEATNGLDQNNMPIPNTGKLSYIDLTQSNPQVVTLMNGLNIPT